MGDVLSLVEEARKTVDVDEAKKFAEKLKKGKGFDLEDFKQEIGQMRKMGGISSMIDKLPAQFAPAAQSAQMDEKQLRRVEGIINSMTPAERMRPEILKASRKRRIAAGAGVPVQEVNRLLNRVRADARDDEENAERGPGEDDARDERVHARDALRVVFPCTDAGR